MICQSEGLYRTHTTYSSMAKPKGWKGQPRRHSVAAQLGWSRRRAGITARRRASISATGKAGYPKSKTGQKLGKARVTKFFPDVGEVLIAGKVRVTPDEMVGTDTEGFIDMLSERLIGVEGLMEVGWKVVGHDGDDVILRVEGMLDEERLYI